MITFTGMNILQSDDFIIPKARLGRRISCFPQINRPIKLLLTRLVNPFPNSFPKLSVNISFIHFFTNYLLSSYMYFDNTL